ncbi:30S ribosomal protein S8 [Candidatus Clavichlamydia salmonicola]|uniref:30S ribosomal protein S8 n=1 Tax=Candidatus Clavichlamydia salmonicola TaxID=469812 RepID=UPI001890D9A0|nr:30S ribosomal protein S8 [Candidatus Clavichlamydia salmonicola]MBF5050759.1 30S ribosomal protein S8 [Candidatus Clavichlamydia salmonicola]
MSISDPIADLLTRIRNALTAEHLFLDINHSRMREAIVKILQEAGFVARYLVKEENKKSTMRIFLKYKRDRESVIRVLKRVSKPSLRVYVSSKEIPRVFGNTGLSIISTSQGVIAGQTARERKLGGELLCLVW